MVVAVCGAEGVGQRGILEVGMTELTDEDMKRRNVLKVMPGFEFGPLGGWWCLFSP